MKVGIFGMNIKGGLVMTTKPQWHPSFSKICNRLNRIETHYSQASRATIFIPISTWKPFGNKSGDAIETISLASVLLSQTNNIDIFSSIHTFAYEPVMVAHVAARLNFEYKNRYKLNILAGWRKEELNYFGKPFSEDFFEQRYYQAEKWLSKFKDAEHEYYHSQLLTPNIDESAFRPTEIISANFSPEGHLFNKQNKLSNLLPLKALYSSGLGNLNRSIIPVSLFLAERKKDAIERYEFLTQKNADRFSAEQFIAALGEYSPVKEEINKRNIENVISGSGTDNLILSRRELQDILRTCELKKPQAIVFSLPDYDETLDLLFQCLEEFYEKRNT